MVPRGKIVRSPGLSEAKAPPPETVITLYSLSRESFFTKILPDGTDSVVHPTKRYISPMKKSNLFWRSNGLAIANCRGRRVKRREIEDMPTDSISIQALGSSKQYRYIIYFN